MISFPDDNHYGAPPQDWQPDRGRLFSYRGDDSDEEYGRSIEALCKSISASYRGMEEFRTLNKALVESYAGPAYGNNSDKRKKYLNKLRQAVVAYSMMLAANRPSVDVESKRRLEDFRVFAAQGQVHLNNFLEEIGLKHTIRQWVLDAYFTLGIVKVHRKDSGVVELEPNVWMDPGQPFASNVLIDDFVFDTGAKTWGEIKWAGDMYRLPLSKVREGAEMGLFDPECVKELTPTSKYYSNQERLESISKGEETDLDEYEPMVDLCDVWVRRDRKIYTFVIKSRTTFSIEKQKPLAVMEWNRDHGPYHLLGFDDVPGNVLPASPAAEMDELDRLINNLMRKQARQAMRQKDGLMFSPQGAPTAKRIRDSGDGDMWQGDPATVAVVSYGGVNPVNQAFLVGCLDLMNDISGNVNAILGLGAQAETLGQEQLIHQAGSRKIGFMQDRVVDAVETLIEALWVELWEDEFLTLSGVMEVGEYQTDIVLEPGQRVGEPKDYGLSVNVISMVHRPPSAQVEIVKQLLGEVYAPFLADISAQGGAIDWQALNERFADALHLPWLADIVTFSTPQAPEATEPTSGKPDVTTRNYNRRSVGTAGTPQARSKVQQAEWLSMASQNTPSQRAMA